MPSRSSLRSAALCAAFVLAAIPSVLRPQALSLALVVPTDETPPSLVVVPDVRGQTLSGAAVRVANVGLVPRHAASSPGDLDTSPVRRQWPRAGQRVPEGTVVALELATAAATPALRPAAERAAASSAGWLARTSVSASFDVRDRAGEASALTWWIAAGLCAPLLALALRTIPPRRAASVAAPPPVDTALAARQAAGVSAAAGGRLRRGVWVKRARGIPRLALASPGAVAAADVAEA